MRGKGGGADRHGVAALEPALISSPFWLKTSSISLPASSLQKLSQWDSKPRATMLGRAASMSFASAFMGMGMTSWCKSLIAVGTSPAAGSAMIRLSRCSAISSAKR